MTWVVKTLCIILLEALADIVALISEDFITGFGINIGAKFPTLAAAKGGKYVINSKNLSLGDVLGSYPNSDTSALFDKVFPLSSFKSLFMLIAVTIAILLFLIEISKVFTSPMVGNKRQHPLTTTGKLFGTLFVTFFSYRIFLIFEYLANDFYLRFGEVALNMINKNPNKQLPEICKSVFNIASQDGESVLKFAGTEIATSLLCIAVTWLVLVNFIKLIVECVERYVVLGFLFYSAPLPAATLVSGETSGIFSSWVKMVVSEAILIITNSMFLSVFINALYMGAQFGTASAGEVNNSNLNSMTWLAYMFMLIAWLQLGQKFDDHLKGLGLATAQTGGGLARDIMAGAATAMGMASTIRSKSRKAIAGNNKKDKEAAGQISNKTDGGVVNPNSKNAAAKAELNKRNNALKNNMSKNGNPNAADTLFGGKKIAGKEGSKEHKDIANAAKVAGATPATLKSLNDAKKLETNGRGAIKATYRDGSANEFTFNGSGIEGKTACEGQNIAGNNIGITTTGASNSSPLFESQAVTDAAAILGYGKADAAAESFANEQRRVEKVSDSNAYQFSGPTAQNSLPSITDAEGHNSIRVLPKSAANILEDGTYREIQGHDNFIAVSASGDNKYQLASEAASFVGVSDVRGLDATLTEHVSSENAMDSIKEVLGYEKLKDRIKETNEYMNSDEYKQNKKR